MWPEVATIKIGSQRSRTVDKVHAMSGQAGMNGQQQYRVLLERVDLNVGPSRRSLQRTSKRGCACNGIDGRSLNVCSAPEAAMGHN